MLDAFANVIFQADAQGHYLHASQLNALRAIVPDCKKRIDMVNHITSSSSAIVAHAARELFAEQPGLIALGGNAYTGRRMAACVRDMEIILRYITYAILAGDSSILDDRCLSGLKETYLALGTPGASVAIGVQKMKDITLTIAGAQNDLSNGDRASLMHEIGSYFDKAIAAIV